MLQFSHIVNQYVIIVVANLAMLQLGISITWSSPVLIKLRNESLTTLDRVITNDEASWIVSILPLAGSLVLFVSGFIIDQFGRKTGLVLIFFPRVLVYLLFTFANKIWMILLGRAVTGFLDLMSASVVSTYTSEIASKEIRGGLGVISQILSSIGMMIMLTVGPYVSYFYLNISCICVTVVVSTPMFFLPESPYYLYTKGRTEEAFKILTHFRASEILASEEIKEYSTIVNIRVPKKEVVKDKTVIKSIVLVMFFGIGYQISGSNVVSFYLQTIFEATNTNVSSALSSAIIGCIQLLGCFCTILLTDRFGRKPILTGTLIGMTLGLTGLGFFFQQLEDGGASGFMNYLPLICLILYIFCFNAGLGSLFWILCAELFNGPARALGITVAVFSSSLSSFLITKYFEAITLAIGSASTYWLFAASCLINCLFIVFFIPETKGKSFAEIQTDLGGNKYDDNKL